MTVPANLVEGFHKQMKKKTQKFQDAAVILAGSGAARSKKKVNNMVNQGTRIIKYMDSEEWLYCRDNTPTLCLGASFDNPTTGAKAIAQINRVSWPAIFHSCVDNDLEGVAHLLESGHDKVNARNPRVGRCGYALMI